MHIPDIKFHDFNLPSIRFCKYYILWFFPKLSWKSRNIIFGKLSENKEIEVTTITIDEMNISKIKINGGSPCHSDQVWLQRNLPITVLHVQFLSHLLNLFLFIFSFPPLLLWFLKLGKQFLICDHSVEKPMIWWKTGNKTMPKIPINSVLQKRRRLAFSPATHASSAGYFC